MRFSIIYWGDFLGGERKNHKDIRSKYCIYQNPSSLYLSARHLIFILN